MPVYQLAHAGIPLTILQRDRLARGITAIHHDVTNAPEPFVRVLFEPLPYGNVYCAGEISAAVVLFGNIRAGRPDSTKQEIVQRCYDLVREVTGATPDQVVVAVDELPSSWLMEAGLFMPKATDEAEAAWIANLQATFPGRYDDWGPQSRPPVATDVDDATRLRQLRDLTQRYLTVARGQGHDVKAFLHQLSEQLSDEPVGASSNGR